MSVMRELTIAVLMRFVITPKDPTTALVSLDIQEMDGPVQSVSKIYCFIRGTSSLRLGK